MSLHQEVAACRFCEAYLPLEPKPIAQFSGTSRILVVGQAPGRITHETGIPFEDKSGERLAEWLGISSETLHDPARVAIVSMGLCYPGKAKGGDNPPRPECAPLWHARILAELPADRLTLLVGTYAQRYYLPDTRKLTMTERIRRYRDYLPRFLPLPHPSWRSTLWMRQNPWFAEEVLPDLRDRVSTLLRGEA
ncbi:uracil-DNA glycosylase family protein [Qipengyuania atrilutea]|uniref:uracil-DNA glycosylase family protein n=1 Tax=Qipengyuania atrilutea TaxID=2744473 RepID=UPI001CED5FCE|nr:uracil-DNA glycosylase family protein [Actirhodobacter atriluteus]